jgi:hypothetical protein
LAGDTTLGAIVIVKLCGALSTGEALSAAAIVNVNVPAVFGVPLSVAVCGGVAARLSPSPGGRIPDVTENPTGVMPPVVEMSAEYGVPAVPPGRVVVVTASGFAACIVNDCVAVCDGTEESVTVTANGNDPTAVAVPLKAPLGASVMPDGSEPLVTTKL